MHLRLYGNTPFRTLIPPLPASLQREELLVEQVDTVFQLAAHLSIEAEDNILL